MKLLKSTAQAGLETSVRNLAKCKDGEKTVLTFTLGKCAGKYIATGELEEKEAMEVLEATFEVNKPRFDDADFAWENILNGVSKGKEEGQMTDIVNVDVGQIEDRTEEFIRLHGDYHIVRNALTGAVEVDGDEVSPSVLNTIWMDYNYKVSAAKINASLDNKYTPVYNPVRKVGEKYSVDCAGSIEEFCSYVESPDEFVRFFKKWYVNMVALGITNVPMHNPLMICLVGEQSVGKTELFRNLLPKELGRYMSDERLKLDSEYFEQGLVRHLIVLNDEMDQVSPKEMDALKRLLTLRTITYRPLYTNTRVQAIRRGSLCGSGNSFDVLNDATGNRRVVPLEITRVRWEEQMEVCRGKMIAEAVGLIDAGYTLHLDGSDIKLLSNGMADKFEILDRESETLLKFFKPGRWGDESGKTEFWTASDIIYVLEKSGGLKSVYVPKFTDKLKKWGFGKSRNKMVKGVQGKRYAVRLIKAQSYYG